MRSPRLPMIDIFSGIGGFSLALRSKYKTIAYCEIDCDAQQILRRNMQKNLIETAAIVDDVRQFTEVLPNISPVLLSAGFPRQDIANARFSSDHQDLQGKRSSLALEILKLVDYHPSLELVLKENSSHFQNRGMASFLQQFIDRGFVVIWGIFSAYESGACHLRNRWFGLAVKSVANLKACHPIHFRPLSNERFVLHSKASRKEMLKRCALLGNAVVPQCANLSFNSFVKALTGKSRENIKANKIAQMFVMHHGTMTVFNRPSKARIDKKLVRMTLENGNIDERNLWATPTFTHWHQYRNTSYRESLNKLISQMCYADDSYEYLFKKYRYTGPKRLVDKFFDVNASWIEALMGFPTGWTK